MERTGDTKRTLLNCVDTSLTIWELNQVADLQLEVEDLHLVLESTI
ncbi:MAG: hypothetical protein HRT71_05840 [Flavobacteriales bacterium]|nr:hypothetical protein [Flavobacteriales bacterium]